MLKDKFKNMFAQKEGENSKKRLENIAVFIVILVITLIVINVIWNSDDENNSNTQTADPNKRLAESSQDTNSVYNEVSKENDMVKDLEDILSKISGVGNVKVMITYAETSKTMPVYNEESTEENTEETDSEGGTRKVTQTDVRKEVVYEESDNETKLITQSVVSPTIEGAIITAEGANDPTVKTNIIQAVGAVTGLATHKIQVFQMAN